ncbi:MAG: AzlD domain-containing protein [Actinomycetia bacterium]|nr:AzlD domain-containing protein [Actinomycetes bacterium]
MSDIWWAILATAVGCYLLKAAGYFVPEAVLQRPRVTRVALLTPVALLAALTAVQVLGDGQGLVLDARAAGLAFAVGALLLRAPFLVVVVGAAIVAALLRLLAEGTAR